MINQRSLSFHSLHKTVRPASSVLACLTALSSVYVRQEALVFLPHQYGFCKFPKLHLGAQIASSVNLSVNEMFCVCMH